MQVISDPGMCHCAAGWGACGGTKRKIARLPEQTYTGLTWTKLSCNWHWSAH